MRYLFLKFTVVLVELAGAVALLAGQPEEAAQPVHLDGEELHVIPACDLAHPLAGEGERCAEALAECVESLRAHGVEGALADHERALPIVAAIEHDEDAAEGTPTPFSLVGMQGTMTLTNSEYDEETRRITSHALWRGMGDASSNGIWEFVDGEWALVYFEVDTSYDGEVNPDVVVDYRTESK